MYCLLATVVITFAAFLVAVPAHAADDASDPYLWLEDVTADRSLGWVKARNAESTAELTKKPEFQALNDRLLKILDSKEKIPFVSKRGAFYYNFWRDEKNKRGLWRRTTLEEYRKAEPKWETVIDLDALAAAEKENWVWHGAEFREPAYDLCMISLSRGGADASVIREFDPQKKAFVEGGFALPEAKTDVAWKDHDTLLVGTDFGPGTMTDSGYARLIKEWARGTPLSAAKQVFEVGKTDMSAGVQVEHSAGKPREFISRQATFWTSEAFVRRGDGQLVRIEKPDDAKASAHGQWLLIELRTPWTVGGKTYAAGALLAADFEGFLKGDRKFDVLFEPTERRSLASASATKNFILLNEMDNVRSRLEVLSRKDGAWVREELPGVPKFGEARASAVDDLESDDYFLNVEDFLTPTTLSLGTAGKGPAEKLKQGPAFFETKGLVVSQHEATSKDGTKVPYFQVSREAVPEDGTTPTLLYGYGGFEISMMPQYSAGVGAAWLEKGGVYVLANIRGGGEFGPTWHQAALKAKRPRAYEDFAAVAEDLVKRKVTSPKHLGTQGGSNGGLLMGNMLTQYPQLFGAVVCQVPLLDMKRYHKLLAGASWMAEYGDPDSPGEWEFIQTFSPYQLVKKDGHYPRTLFTTSTRDDRVHPGHARKMVARMKEMGHDVLYYENIEGGHGGAADNKQRAFMNALAYTFLWNELK
jgi:prolyl oligopeptidase